MSLGRSWLLIITAIFLGIILSGCKENVALALRTDTEPIARRLNLPKVGHSIRWVAVSPVHDTGWIPPRAEFYEVYAYIELDNEAWTAMDNSAGEQGVRGAIIIPEAVAVLMIPPSVIGDFKQSNDGRQAEGPSFNSTSLAADARTEVQKAIRVGGALVVQMRVH